MKNPKEIDKYVFVGAQSTGKTTLTEKSKIIFRDYPTVKVLDEAARIFFDQRPNHTDRSYRTQLEIQNFALDRERQLYTPSTDIIIADRSVVDPIVLSTIWDPEHTQLLHNNVADWLTTYKLFFILDLNGVPSEEGEHRQETPEERQKIQKTLIDYFIANKLRYELISGSLDERVAKVKASIISTTQHKQLFK